MKSIYCYMDYRLYVKDWIDDQKQKNKNYQMKDLAKKLSLNPPVLSLILSSKRNFPLKKWPKLVSVLGFSKQNEAFFEALRVLNDVRDPELKKQAFMTLKKNPTFQKTFQKEIHSVGYLKDWLNVAIRELITLPDFESDVGWMRKRLGDKRTSREIESALRYLVKIGYVDQDPKGHYFIPKDHSNLELTGGIYQLFFKGYYEQVLDHAKKAIYFGNRTNRLIENQTLALSPEEYEKASQILSEARQKVIKMVQNKENSGKLDSREIYQITLCATPVTVSQGLVEDLEASSGEDSDES